MYFGIILGLPFMLLTFGSFWIILRGLKIGKRFYDKSIIAGSLGILVVIIVASRCGGYIGYIGSPAIPFVCLQTLAGILVIAMEWHILATHQKIIFLFLIFSLPVLCFCGIAFQNNQIYDENAKTTMSIGVKWIGIYFRRHGAYPASLKELNNDFMDVMTQETNGSQGYPDELNNQMVGFSDEHWLYRKTNSGFFLGNWDYPPDVLSGYYTGHHSFPGIMGPRVCVYNSSSETYECGVNRWEPFLRPPNAK